MYCVYVRTMARGPSLTSKQRLLLFMYCCSIRGWNLRIPKCPQVPKIEKLFPEFPVQHSIFWPWLRNRMALKGLRGW